jgi:CRP-like cAMP-binding protein
VIQVVTDALLASPIENVADDPKPNVVCMDFAKDGRESYAAYAARYWILELAPDDPTSSRVRARIYTALRRAEIPLAIPAQANLIEVRDRAREESHRAREIAEHLRALEAVPLFHELEPAELRSLAEGLSHAVYTAGETITKQGAVAHWLYVMTSDIDGDGKEEIRVVAKLTAPDFFGEMGLMTGEARSADVVATSDVECFRLGKPIFERVLLARPGIADMLADKLATRNVQLLAIRGHLGEEAQRSRHASERARILDEIRNFFGL